MSSSRIGMALLATAVGATMSAGALGGLRDAPGQSPESSARRISDVLKRQPGARTGAVSQPSQPALPAMWIGVRLEQVPEAVAAHVGTGGLMIANVAKDSPADKAGLDRYDILSAIDGEPIADMESLVQRIQQSGAGAEISLKVIHAGKERSVSLAAVARPDPATIAFRYEDAAIDEATRYFGHAFRRGPGGTFFFEPLGELRDLPDFLRDLPQPDNPAWKDALKGLPDAFQVFTWREKDDAAEDGTDDEGGQRVFNISVMQDGHSIQIHRGQDGKIEVQRREPDGAESRTTYDSLEDLREKDREAYDMCRRAIGRRMSFVVPGGGPWLDLARRQERWSRQMEEAVQKLRTEAQVRVQHWKDQAGRLRSELSARAGSSTQVQVHGDGSVHLTIQRGGKVESYAFESREEFKAREPELYESVEGLLNELSTQPQEQERSWLCVGVA
jgi:hypothetical protein